MAVAKTKQVEGTKSAPAWEVKDRMYFLLGDVTPLTYKIKSKNIPWFDEELDTPNLGPSRGTGVLKKNAGEWKIEHYNLTVPIPNDIVDDVVKQIEDYSKSGK